ncbi:hypothetical protein V6N12_058530 [Hibiscus sabdariffa]|uniref:Reverse transcriptase zinc-binding domain-containing protein n=1 Tax=Hibiscus sabdariffa TaxID=183260 RepID=A0ABR2ESF1_9ROSI
MSESPPSVGFTPVSVMVSSDRDWNWHLGWLWNGGHDFSVNLGYDVRAHYSSAFGDGLWKIIHKFRGLERMKSFLWLVCKGCVLANSKRVRRHIASLAACVACGAVVEDLDHLLWQC